MPQTGVKLEFFPPFAAKLLKIVGICRNYILWITLCIEFFQRVIQLDLIYHKIVISINFI